MLLIPLMLSGAALLLAIVGPRLLAWLYSN
jgi:hypothetical protein